MKSHFFFLILILLSSLAAGRTIYVPDDYAVIQDAIDSSANGDVIVVRPGTYMENLNFHRKAITVRSESGPLVTVIDGGQSPLPDHESVVTFASGEALDSVIMGFTLTNGKGTYHASQNGIYGAGIFCEASSPTIVGNIIRDNSLPASYKNTGAGIYCHGSSPLIQGNTITRNVASGIAGVSCDHHSAGTFTGNTVSFNTGGGGGMSCSNGSTVLVSGNRFVSNTAKNHGGGLYIANAAPLVVNNVIADNWAFNFGGGIFCLECAPRFVNNTICNNSCAEGGGIHLVSYSTVTVVNTILWNNSAPKGKEIFIGSTPYPSTLTISHSNVEDGYAGTWVNPGCTMNWGTGMIDVDSLFVAPAELDFHLTYTSGCLDRGDPAATGLPAGDFENDPRISGAGVDIGADEAHPHLYHRYGATATPGESFELRCIGSPGSDCAVLFGSRARKSPLVTPYGELWLAWPFQWIKAGQFPVTGYLGFPVSLSPGLPAGKSFYLQAISGTTLTNVDIVTVR